MWMCTYFLFQIELQFVSVPSESHLTLALKKWGQESREGRAEKKLISRCEVSINLWKVENKEAYIQTKRRKP